MEEIWLVGAGYMAKEYARVLKALNRQFVVIGRGRQTARDFEKTVHLPVATGGVTDYINVNRRVPRFAIVTVDAQYLHDVAKEIINLGVEKVLLEKPGALTVADITELQRLSSRRKSSVFIAYNRRFYASVQKAREIVKQDGGCSSFSFEFTEWSHLIKDSKKSRAEKKRWFVANSTHVVDLAFFLGGRPRYIVCYTSGGLDWHPSSSVFAGAGVAGNHVLFSYAANWEAPGRWGVEVLTRKRRLILRPLEELQCQELGSVDVRKISLADKFDKLFKPGLYGETQSFLNGAHGDLKPLSDQVVDMKLYYKMAGY